MRTPLNNTSLGLNIMTLTKQQSRYTRPTAARGRRRISSASNPLRTRKYMYIYRHTWMRANARCTEGWRAHNTHTCTRTKGATRTQGACPARPACDNDVCTGRRMMVMMERTTNTLKTHSRSTLPHPRVCVIRSCRGETKISLYFARNCCKYAWMMHYSHVSNVLFFYSYTECIDRRARTDYTHLAPFSRGTPIEVSGPT